MFNIFKNILFTYMTFATSFIAAVLIINFFLAKIYNLEYNFSTVYGVFPVLTVYDPEDKMYSFNGSYTAGSASSIRDDTVSGASIGPLIIIHEPNAHSSKDALLHERQHVKQNYRSGLFSIILDILSEKYRIISEYEAYMAEDEVYSKEEIAILLSDSVYNTEYSYEKILGVLHKLP